MKINTVAENKLAARFKEYLAKRGRGPLVVKLQTRRVKPPTIPNNRQVLEHAAKGASTTKQRKDRWEVYGSCCYLCGKPAEATDHVVPLAKGGSNWPANLRPICKHCNSTKGSKWPYDFQGARE